MKAPHILVADGDLAAREHYQAAMAPLKQSSVVFVDDAASAIQRLEQEAFDVLIAGNREGPNAAVNLLEKSRRADSTLAVIVVEDEPNSHMAVASFRRGAGDYISRPIEPTELTSAILRLLNQRRGDDEHQLLRDQIEKRYRFDSFVGSSPAMQRIFTTIDQVAATDVDVLINGETGTGKELVARAIHRRSNRAELPFVAVDCGAIPENLLESEFFGYERGAFTGAENRRIGLLEFADGGTFFLDEIGELPVLLQAKLLRTLQERKFRRVGGREEIPVNVRIIAATGRNLEDMVEQRQFRDDLFYRINVIRINLPPLRDRGDDLGLLIEHFSQRFSREMGKPVVGITPEAYQVLSQYEWKGNIRELQNVVRRGIVLSSDSMIGLDDLPDAVIAAAGEKGGAEGSGFFQERDEHVARFERDYITQLLRQHGGNVKSAAREAKLPRGTLYRLMKNHGIEGTEFRS